MKSVTLFASPGACSQISLVILEKIGAPYTLHPVILAKGEHKTDVYLRINPKAKVPALKVEDQIITETPAILLHLHEQFPNAGILPAFNDISLVQQVSDLSYFSSTLHPLITRYCKPELIGDDASTKAVSEKAELALRQALSLASKQLAQHTFWYGESWCALDVYLLWVVNRTKRCGFSLAAFPEVARHHQAMLSIAPVKRALLKEQDML